MTITLTPTQVKLLAEMIENHFELWKHFSNVSREDALALQNLNHQLEATCLMCNLPNYEHTGDCPNREQEAK